MPIQVLSKEVATAIAAGEVVERPMSVVKELIENAIDAGARRVDVAVERGGRSLIEVTDDGSGIPAEEITLAVARYATSKLASMEDLFAVKTLGFRGEALASIGAVSRMELISRAGEEAGGVRLTVEGGEVGLPKVVGAPSGTVVRVRHLFYNVPARQKFLKSETTERRRISELVARYALAYPQVRFKLTQEGRLSFHTSGRGDRREALAGVFGVEVARQMIHLSEGSPAEVQVTGFVSSPSVTRSNRRELTFFVNGRWIQDASLAAAVMQAYHGLLMVGRYPLAILLLDLAPDALDVNVHPAKAEVRFREPDLAFRTVQRAVRAALLNQATFPAVGLDSRWWPGGPETFRREVSTDGSLAGTTEKAEADQPLRSQGGLPGARIPLLRPVGQVGASYLVAEGPDGLYLIDQHAAHERVLFERLLSAKESGEVEAQSLLEPVTVALSPAQADLLEDRLETLRRLGFGIEPFGGSTFRVRAIPALLVGLAADQALRVVVEDFEEDETPLAVEIEAQIAARVCKRAAVKSGQILSVAEQGRLIGELEACEAPRTCPHGRPTMIHLSVEALERQFGRKG